MKKTLLTGLLALAGFTAQAQLPAGSMAPDFTLTDIDGVEHNLQGYLDQGKTVMIDVSATWCGPCWGLHEKHVMKDLYYAYGPGGSDEMVVLFIEGDGSTTMDDLNGTGGNTQGDWVTGTPYPIIDSPALNTPYDVGGFPTMYRICPNGEAYNMPNMTNTSTATILAQILECNALTGLENHGKVSKGEISLCEANGASDFGVEIKNYGTNAITSAQVALMDGETVVATQDFSGNVAAFGTGTVEFTGVTVDAAANYTVQLTQINGGAPALPESSLNTNTVDVSIAGQAENNFIAVLVHTDNYPGEISWDIKDSEGNIIANGGPYQEGTADQWGGGGPDANTTKMHLVEIAEGTADCFTVNMYDSFNDGWQYGNTIHGMEIVSNDVTVFSSIVSNFGSELSHANAFKTNGTLSNGQFETSSFSVYPNPSNGVFNFSTEETVGVTVMDLTGKVVFTAKEINNGDTMNLSNLQKGMYIAKIEGATTERTEKLVIK